MYVTYIINNDWGHRVSHEIKVNLIPSGPNSLSLLTNRMLRLD